LPGLAAPGGPQLIGRVGCKRVRLAAIGVHDINLEIPIPLGLEDDLLAIRRPGREQFPIWLPSGDQSANWSLDAPKVRRVSSVPSRAAYSNFNYMVLGAIIEAVSGQSYETYIAENILQPLGMSQTGFIYTPAMGEYEVYGTLPVVDFYTRQMDIEL
jgi:CubicO group peptidase (beta-lactamase class C family)